MAAECADHRLRRLLMRSARRGTKEMDLVLGPFAQARLAAMPPDILDAYEDLLEENDQELYAWVTGRDAAPQRHADLIRSLQEFHIIM